jgi:hypothetical protein
MIPTLTSQTAAPIRSHLLGWNPSNARPQASDSCHASRKSPRCVQIIRVSGTFDGVFHGELTG